jgi:hypothetical protein
MQIIVPSLRLYVLGKGNDHVIGRGRSHSLPNLPTILVCMRLRFELPIIDIILKMLSVCRKFRESPIIYVD